MNFYTKDLKMNKSFKIIFFALSLVFSQVALSQTIESRAYELILPEYAIEASFQTSSDKTIFVNNITDCDMAMVVFYEGKIKVYYAYPPLDTLQEIQEFFDSADKKEAPHIYSDSNDPIFHTSVVNFKDAYYYNKEHCFINAEKSINSQDCIIESPHILLKAKDIEIMSFLIDTETIEFQSNKELSLLSSIKLTLKDKTDVELQPFILGTADFDYNFVFLMCSSVDKIELRCLPESFYINENAICFT